MAQNANPTIINQNLQSRRRRPGGPTDPAVSTGGSGSGPGSGSPTDPHPLLPFPPPSAALRLRPRRADGPDQLASFGRHNLAGLGAAAAAAASAAHPAAGRFLGGILAEEGGEWWRDRRRVPTGAAAAAAAAAAPAAPAAPTPTPPPRARDPFEMFGAEMGAGLAAHAAGPDPDGGRGRGRQEDDHGTDGASGWREPIDDEEVYDLIAPISDPEHPLSLGSLGVINLEDISITGPPTSAAAAAAAAEPTRAGRGGQASRISTVTILLTPTISHCSLATVIGLGVRVRLERSLPARYRVDVAIKPGTHSTAEQVTKQLMDKERVAAALENDTLAKMVRRMIVTCR